MAVDKKSSEKQDAAWPAGVVWKKHRRRNAAGEVEEVRTPYVRVRVTIDGRRRALWRQVKTPAEAVRVAARLADKLAAGESEELLAARMTFADLADYFERHYVVEAEYVDGRKVAGLRDVKHAEFHLSLLRTHFGKKPLRSITYGSVKHFKLWLLKEPVTRRLPGGGRVEVKGPDGRPRTRSITTVHRVLQLLRHMLSVAVREGWLQKNPFNQGDPLINPADERGRRRILSREEESRLLLACGAREKTYNCRRGGRVVEVTMRDQGLRRGHLRALLICLLDTAMRAGEALKLTWDDLNLSGRHATVQEFNTKTLRERSAPVSERLARELAGLHPVTSARRDRLVFGLTNNFRTSFRSACRAAGIAGLRVHDLRRTAATRLVRGGMAIEEVSRILGHTNIQTTYRYIGVDDETVARAAAIIDGLNREAAAAEASETVN